eukprot:6475864-Amphidinium_carterae.1
MQPLFNNMHDEANCEDGKLLYLCYALGVELDTWLPSHYIEECWYQDTFTELCCQRYLALGSRLSTLPASAKIWEFNADDGKVALVMCGRRVEVQVPSCPVPAPADACIDNCYGLSAKFLCPSAFVTVPLLEIVKALPDGVLGDMRQHLVDPAKPWEMNTSVNKRCRDEALDADTREGDQILPPKSAKMSIACSSGSQEQPVGVSRLSRFQRKSSFSQSIFSQLKGTGKAPVMQLPPS